MLYLIRPIDHRERECQAEPEFVTKHCRRVSGMVVDRMYSCLRRRQAVICMHYVHGVVSEMCGFGNSPAFPFSLRPSALRAVIDCANRRLMFSNNSGVVFP